MRFQFVVIVAAVVSMEIQATKSKRHLSIGAEGVSAINYKITRKVSAKSIHEPGATGIPAGAHARNLKDLACMATMANGN